MTLLLWKSLMHRKWQSLAIVISIAVGAAILFCVAAVYNGVNAGLELSQQRMGADIVIIPGGVTMEPSLYLFGGATANSYMPADTLEKVRAVPGIVQATPQFFTHTLTADCHDIGTSNRMLGYDPDSDWIVGPWLKKVHKSQLADDEVILGAKVPVWAGDKIAILGKWYQIVTTAEETGTTLDYSLFVSMAEARRVAASSPQLQGVWEEQGPAEGLISTILVKVDPAASMTDIITGIQYAGFLQPIVAAEVKKRIADQFTVLALLLGGVGSLAVLASLLQLFSRLYALIWERQAEWGLYLAIGAAGCDIAKIVAGEALVIALSGSLTGLLLGGVLYQGVLALLEWYESFPFFHPSWIYLLTTGLLITGLYSGLGALAAWLPAYRGSRLDPGIIMTRGEFD